MKKLIIAPTLALVMTLACIRPEVETFRKAPPPVVVQFRLPDSVHDSSMYEKEYAAALRARLAMRMMVVPEGLPAPPEAARLTVTIQQIEQVRRDLTPGQKGALAGVAVGFLSALAGHRNTAVFDGIWTGLWVGSHAAAHERYERREGHRSIDGYFTLTIPGEPHPIFEGNIDAWDVVEMMDRSAFRDGGDVREQEARALARIVVSKLADEFQMPYLNEPRWYGSSQSAPNPEKPADVSKE